MKIRLILICVLLMAGSVFAQDDLLPRAQSKIAVTMAPAAPITVTPGKPAHVELQFRVSPGYHINSNKPNSDLLIPTVLKLDAQTGLLVGKVTYPEGENLTFPFAPNEKLNVYTGDFAITAQISAAKSTPAGHYRIHGQLTSQACDNKACYPPKNLPVAFDINVRKAASARTRRSPGQSPHVHR